MPTLEYWLKEVRASQQKELDALASVNASIDATKPSGDILAVGELEKPDDLAAFQAASEADNKEPKEEDEVTPKSHRRTGRKHS